MEVEKQLKKTSRCSPGCPRSSESTAQVIDYDELRTGERNEATFTMLLAGIVEGSSADFVTLWI